MRKEKKKKKDFHRVVDMREKKIKWCWSKYFLWTCGFAINPNWAKREGGGGMLRFFPTFML